jgi:hypothetical protein
MSSSAALSRLIKEEAMGRWDGLDRRKFPRVKYPCLVVIGHDEQGNRDVLLTHTENIGQGGVSVTLRKHVKMFSPIQLEVDLLDLGNHIKCNGKVVWNVQRKSEDPEKPFFYDIGIEFVDIKADDQARLIEIVKRLVKANKKNLV